MEIGTYEELRNTLTIVNYNSIVYIPKRMQYHLTCWREKFGKNAFKIL